MESQWMSQMGATLRRDEGQTLAEYALILALIALVAVVAMTAIGDQIGSVFSTLTNKLS